MISELGCRRNRDELIESIENEVGVCDIEVKRKLLENTPIPVYLMQTNETGEMGWAVVMDDLDNYWLGFLPRYREAVDFCYNLNLVVEN